MTTIGQGAGGKCPGAASIGGRRADLGHAVEHFHRAAGNRRAGQGHMIDVGDAVAGHIAVRRERRHGRSCHCLNDRVQDIRDLTDVAGRIRSGSGEIVRTRRKWASGDGPGSRCIRHSDPQQGRPFEETNSASCFSAARYADGRRRHVGIRDKHRGCWSGRINGNVQRRYRGHADVAGGIDIHCFSGSGEGVRCRRKPAWLVA